MHSDLKSHAKCGRLRTPNKISFIPIQNNRCLFTFETGSKHIRLYNNCHLQLCFKLIISLLDDMALNLYKRPTTRAL